MDSSLSLYVQLVLQLAKGFLGVTRGRYFRKGISKYDGDFVGTWGEAYLSITVCAPDSCDPVGAEFLIQSEQDVQDMRNELPGVLTRNTNANIIFRILLSSHDASCRQRLKPFLAAVSKVCVGYVYGFYRRNGGKKVDLTAAFTDARVLDDLAYNSVGEGNDVVDMSINASLSPDCIQKRRQERIQWKTNATLSIAHGANLPFHLASHIAQLATVRKGA